MALVLDDESIKKYTRRGWKVFTPGYDMTYKSQWSSDWYIVREFYQNALDEHDEAGIPTLPTLHLYSQATPGKPLALVIEDQGRGVGAESLLLRETKGTLDLRGQFGEGLKFACLAAVRNGYGVRIESPYAEIFPAVQHTVMGTKEVALLVFLWRPQGRRQVGTRVEISDYRGHHYRDRFVPLIPRTSNWYFSPPVELGRFFRKYAIFTQPPNRLYVRDIYVRDLDLENPSIFSYNLWKVELNPDRDAERYSHQLSDEITTAWCLCDAQPMIELLLAALSQKTYESYMHWSTRSSYRRELESHKDIWQAAWKRVFGSDAVIQTSKYFQERAAAFGYKVIPYETIPEQAAEFLTQIIPTDLQRVGERGEEIQTGIVLIRDAELTTEQLSNLNILRFFIEYAWEYRNVIKAVRATALPPDPRTGIALAGLWEEGPRVIDIQYERLQHFWEALPTFYHEAGHALSHNAADGTIEHSAGIEYAATAGSRIIRDTTKDPGSNRQYAEMWAKMWE